MDQQFLTGGVAIIGMAGRFPGASDLVAFWDVLREGRETATRFSRDELIAAGVPADVVDQPDYVPVAARLDGATDFDADFFAISPGEAQVIDPQHRVLLECAVEALNDAGCDPMTYPGAIGLMAGAGLNVRHLGASLAQYGGADAAARWLLLMGNDKDFLATRVSYKLRLRGPSLTVQTACSTSLVAVHLACQSLLSGECDVALAGGVSVMNSFEPQGYLHSPGDVLSPDGRCRPFDAEAAGTIWADGVGLVVLKRLDQALADGDRVRAVIRASAMNNDGAGKVGYTAPSVGGQAAVIAEALALAETPADTISYVEAHGTGTELGDPIEVAGLTQAFRLSTSQNGFCALGSVKGNIGHLNAAAGVAGLIKTVLSLEHEALPASLNFTRPNPKIDFENTPFRVNAAPTSWPRGETPRRAGVSSFGIGGTNAHVVLEEAPPQVVAASGREHHLLVLSARTPQALAQARMRLADRLRVTPNAALADVAHTLMTGRTAHAHRAAVVCASADEAVRRLSGTGMIEGVREADGVGPILMFPGQGAQRLGMGAGLYRNEPVFRAAFDACADGLAQPLGVDLRKLLFAPGDEAAEVALTRTQLAQPALFAVSYALAQQVLAWGLEPAGLVGHSLGELTAACVAGVLDLPDALIAVEARGRLMQAAPEGAMLAVLQSAAEARVGLDPALTLAAENGPGACVVAGPEPAVAALEARLRDMGVGCARLRTSHAFHTPAMAAAAAAFQETMAGLKLSPPKTPFISNVTGDWISAADAVDPPYWARQIRSPVRFADGLEAVARRAPGLLLELGPGRTLQLLAQQNPATRPLPAVAALPNPDGSDAEAADLLRALGHAWTCGQLGATPDLYPGETRQKISLPTYPFQRQAFPPPSITTSSAAETGPARGRVHIYAPTWRRCAPEPPVKIAGGKTWLLLDADGPFAARLSEALERRGDRVERCATRSSGGEATLESRTATLGRAGVTPDGVISLAGLQAAADAAAGIADLLGLSQEIAAGDRGPCELIVLSANGHDVLGGEPVNPAAAALAGPCLTLAVETPDRGCRCLDLSRAELDRDSSAVAEAVALALLARPAHPLGALRRGAVWAPQLQAVDLPACAPPLRQGAVVLITGGLGDLGLAMAELLFRTCAARLVLMSRTPAPPRDTWPAVAGDRATVVTRLLALEEAGAELVVAAGDVADEASLRATVETARARFGRIDVVLHAAGVAAEGIAVSKSRAQIDTVLHPKIEGVQALARVFADAPVDQAIMFSSISAVIGFPGMADYAGANAYLDACAEAPSTWAKSLVSINWDSWRELGMAVKTDVPDAFAQIKAAMLRNALSTAEACDAFLRILGGNMRRAVVTRLASPFGGMPTAPTISMAVAAARGHARPDLATPYVEPRSELEATAVRILAEVLEVDRVGIDDNFLELGGHSLMAMQFVARFRAETGVAIPLRALFEALTVREIADGLSLHASDEIEV
jgi:phthiocerol/phenolphthiocerol synthesis type-I polyketide synthase E